MNPERLNVLNLKIEHFCYLQTGWVEVAPVTATISCWIWFVLGDSVFTVWYLEHISMPKLPVDSHLFHCRKACPRVWLYLKAMRFSINVRMYIFMQSDNWQFAKPSPLSDCCYACKAFHSDPAVYSDKGARFITLNLLIICKT